MVTTEPAVARARLIGLGLELYPANMLGMLYKLTSLDSCRVFRQNREGEERLCGQGDVICDLVPIIQ